MVKALLASPKGEILIPFILENRIRDFRQQVNKGKIGIWPIGNFQEEDIQSYKIYVVNYAKQLNPKLNVDEWVEALELVILKNEENAKEQSEKNSLFRVAAEAERVKRRAFIVSAPYGTEIVKEEYEAHVPAEQKYLWKVSRTETIQTGWNESYEKIFYKKYPPGENPEEIKGRDLWQSIIDGSPVSETNISLLTPEQQGQLIFSHTKQEGNFHDGYDTVKYYKLRRALEMPTPSAPPQQVRQYYLPPEPVPSPYETVKERVRRKAIESSGKPARTFLQTTGNIGRTWGLWGGRGARKISRKSIMAKLSCPRCTRSCRTMRSMMKHLKSAHGMSKTASRSCCKRAMKAATRKAKGSRKAKKGTRRR